MSFFKKQIPLHFNGYIRYILLKLLLSNQAIMRKYLFLVFIAVCVFQSTHATIRRLGYPGTSLAGVDYSSFSEAQTASAPGDTIQIYGSQNDIITVTKRLVIMGFGNNFDKITGVQLGNPSDPSKLNTVFLNAGSDSSLMVGLYVYNAYVGSSNIQLQRCNFANYLYVNYNGIVNNTSVTSSYINYLVQYSTNYNCNNLLIANSIIRQIYFGNSQVNGMILNCVSPASTYTNTWYLGPASFLVRNCILATGIGSNTNSVYENNFFTSTQPTTPVPGSNNRWGQTYSTLFNRLGGTSDLPSSLTNAEFNENYFQLSASSPAIHGGIDLSGAPTDCGIFGGEPAFVFKPGFVPAIPTIYNLTVPSLEASNNPFNITVSVKSNN